MRSEKESSLVHIDDQGTVHIPKFGVAVETWFFHHGQLGIPDNNRPNGQHPLAFFGVDTRIVFSGGTCNIVLFPIAALTERFAAGTPPEAAGRFIGAEYRINGCEGIALNEMMIMFVIRSFTCNDFGIIRRLEYRENYLWVNGNPFIHFPVSPGHCFFIDGRPEDLAEYFLHREGNTQAVSSQGNCTGLIGYSGLDGELNGTTYFLNFSSKARVIKGGFNSFLRTGSDLVWHERFSFQKRMIDAGSSLNGILSGTFPHLIAFSGTVVDKISPLGILTLNRWGLYNESRLHLQKAIHNAILLNIVKNRSTCCVLPFLIYDYYRFSRDSDFVGKCRSVLQTIGNWLIYMSGFGLKKFAHEKEIFQNEDALGFCASLKAMAFLAKTMYLPHESAIYQERYFHFRLQMLHRIQETFLRAEPFGNKRTSIREWMNVLAGVFPFNLWEKESEWVKWIIKRVGKDYYRAGGVAAPWEFDGLHLRFTAAFGQVLLRVGFNYRPIFDDLFEAAEGVWNWPDIMDPLNHTGIGEYRHDPETLFRILLMVRNLFVMEDDEVLELLPGFSDQVIWRCSRISLHRLPTHFGEIECDYRNVGLYTEINLNANYWKKPSAIRIRRNDKLSLMFCDAWVRESSDYWEFGPELRRLRFKVAAAADGVSRCSAFQRGREDYACLDNTFFCTL